MAHLLWDMDGTLLDSTKVVPDAFVETARALGVTGIDHARVTATYALNVPEVSLPRLLGRPATDAELDLYYERLLGRPVAPYEGVPETLAALREQGRSVAVFTGASSRAAAILLRAAGIEIDLLVGGEQVEHPKPAPDGILRAAGLLGTAPTDIVYVGDAPSDLRAAVAAGAWGAAATWGHLYDPAEPAAVVLTRPQDVLPLL